MNLDFLSEIDYITK